MFSVAARSTFFLGGMVKKFGGLYFDVVRAGDVLV